MKVLKYKYNPNKKGVFRVSIVKNPAVGEGDLVLMSTIPDTQEIKGVFYSPVMIPDVKITRINPETGEKRFNLAVGISLLIFYAFAMQCMGTLAIVKRETKSWRWPLAQLIGMGILAYIASFITFTIFS